MAATTTALTMWAGTTKTFNLTLYADDGVTPINLTGSPAIVFLAKRSLFDPDANAIISKSLAGATITVGTAVLGQITVTVAPADTDQIVVSTVLQWACKVTLAGVETLGALGTLTVSPDAIQAV